MLQRLIDDFKAETGVALRMTSLAAVVGGGLLITTGFLTAAAFVAVLNRYGVIQACLTGAGIFLLITLFAVGLYFSHKRQAQRRIQAAAARVAAEAEEMKSQAGAMLTDPAVLAIGIELVRSIGVKRMLPLLAIGGVALGLMASRSFASKTAAE